ncbi:MAG: 30S ribosomal protein S21 [bacterium]|nr:30S ribosomal protein S21 [bacterium]MBK8130820.1 30S ribosomal protein S21 [bacterium]
MTFVKARDGEPMERLVRRFQKACEKSGVLSELRRRQFYEKPSETNKREESQTKRKIRKINRILRNR